MGVVWACLLWSLLWLITQSLYMTHVPYLSDALTTQGNPAYDSVRNFSVVMMWCVFIVAATTFVWSWWSKNDFHFLRVSRWTIIGYGVLVCVGVPLAFRPELLGMPGWLQVLFMAIGTVVQDLPAFGFLQTALEKQTNNLLACGIVAVMFMLGHFVWLGQFDLVIACGAVLFAMARMLTGSVYAAHMLHLGFYVVSLWFVV